MQQVRSEPLVNGERAVKSAPIALAPLWPAGIAAILFGVPLWLVGAFYTLQGWVMGLNLVTAAIHLPAHIPLPTGWWVLLFIPLGLLYSWVEIHRPTRASAAWVVAYLLVILSDLATTYLSVTAADATTISRWAAATIWASFIWAAILTFAPEWLMIGGVRLIRKAR